MGMQSCITNKYIINLSEEAIVLFNVEYKETITLK